MNRLADRKCVPCEGGVPPLRGEELRNLANQLSGWQLIDEHHIQKSYLFPDFVTALDFVNRVAAIAEEQGHHPDLTLSWGQVGVKISTHAVRGLTENDFILGAKIDALPLR